MSTCAGIRSGATWNFNAGSPRIIMLISAKLCSRPPRDFLTGGGGGVNAIQVHVRVHLAAFLEIIERGGAIGIRLPDFCHASRGVNEVQPQVGDYPAGGGRIVRFSGKPIETRDIA